MLAACSPSGPGNAAPEVTITSPGDAATYSLGETIVFTATATDAEDGDLTTGISWTSSIDGALSPSASGEATLSLGNHVVTARVSDSAGAEGTDSVSVTVTEAAATHVVSDGTTLRLVSVSGGQIEELDSAAITGGGIGPYASIFGIVGHPTQPWLYVSSMSSGWGEARIDRFVLAGDTIEHAGAAFSYPFSGIEAGCLGSTWDYCSVVGMSFSSDGSRFYAIENDWSRLQVFSVDTEGNLAFIAEGASTSMHGLAIDPTDTYLYNGSNVIEVTDDAPDRVFSGERGNATQIVEVAGAPVLVSTWGTNRIATYDLSDPLAPTQIAMNELGSNQVRDLDFTAELQRIVVVGRNNVNTLAYDGAAFTQTDTHTITEAYDLEYRGVALSEDGGYALVAWFDDDSGAPSPGGAHLFEVGDDGSLTLVDSQDYLAPSRVVHSVR